MIRQLKSMIMTVKSENENDDNNDYDVILTTKVIMITITRIKMTKK